VTVAPSPTAAQPRAVIDAPPSQAEPVEVTRTKADDSRQALEADRDPGTKVAFGSIEGIVVDRKDAPIADAQIALLNSKPSVLGEEIHALRGTEPPRPVAKFTTAADGTFHFDQLDPRKDWSLVVTHERYVSYTTEVAITVPEGKAWKETVIMEEGQTASGTVRDAKTSQPIAGAQLVIDGPFARMSKKKSPGRIEATTDATGAFSFQNVGAASAQGRILTITANGYATQVRNFHAGRLRRSAHALQERPAPWRARRTHLDFELEPGKVIAGRS
jgi:hypothetical protein